jgi:hypothetical protein
MHNQGNGRTVPTTKRWKLTLCAEDASPRVLTGLSTDQMRRAVSTLMSGNDDPIEQLTGESCAAPLDRAA